MAQKNPEHKNEEKVQLCNSINQYYIVPLEIISSMYIVFRIEYSLIRIHLA